MNFLALLLGLGVERLLTHLFHLREFRWLDPLFDFALGQLRGAQPPLAVIALALLALLLATPVAWASVMLSPALLHIPYFIFAVVVLLFSLGPRDLKEEVEDYCEALGSGALEDTRRVAWELVEGGLPEAPDAQIQKVERAIYIQANNRIFGVIFWFVLLGPTGAWLFRVIDLMRHRAARHDAGQARDSTLLIACQALHGVLAWLPARLVAAGYALAGSFEAAVSAWRSEPERQPEGFFETTEELLARVGQGARNRAGEDPGSEPRDAGVARAAIGLVTRTLWLIWYPVIGLLTLTNWLR